MVIGWRAWFVDIPNHTKLLRFESNTTSFLELPDNGCLGFVLYYDTNKPDGNPHRLYLKSQDYYFNIHDEVKGCVAESGQDTVGDIKKNFPDPYIIAGRWTLDALMEQAEVEMVEAAICP